MSGGSKPPCWDLPASRSSSIRSSSSTIEAPDWRRIEFTRGAGIPGSIGTHMPPAFSTASIATT